MPKVREWGGWVGREGGRRELKGLRGILIGIHDVGRVTGKTV